MMLATDLVVLDHYDGTAFLVANAILPEDASEAATSGPPTTTRSGRLDAMTTALSRPTPPMISTVDRVSPGEVLSRTPAGDYPKAVEQAKEAIRAGECFQIVVGQRFERATDADPLDVYRVLRATNPSPYMYLLRFDDFDIVGSSPEAHLKVSAAERGVRRAILHPIAGTRWRGATPEQDNALAAELLADPKERAEHVMLVDLGRNDLGRVCAAGHGRGAGLRPRRAVQPRHAHRLHGGRSSCGRRSARRSTRWPRRSRRARCRARPRCGRWRSSRSWSRPGAASTAVRSATSDSPATWTWRSRSGPR